MYFVNFRPTFPDIDLSNINTRLSMHDNIYEQLYPNTVLTDMWGTYKQQFIQEDGRTIDKGAGLITTSEGQSYTMLRSVWVDDRQTFDKAWKWTNVNLKKRIFTISDFTIIFIIEPKVRIIIRYFLYTYISFTALFSNPL